MSGKCVGKASCPSCGSSDGVQIFEQDDGKRDGFCFACQTRYPKAEDLSVTAQKQERRSMLTIQDVNSLPSADLPERKLRKETLEFFGVKVGVDPSDRKKIGFHFYPAYKASGELIGYKARKVATKEFFKVGETKGAALFGQNVCPINRKLFITEGELDALSLFQAIVDTNRGKFQGMIPSVVSVTNGASGAVKQLMEQQEFLDKFEEIILVFDNDEAGKKAAEEVAKTVEHKKILLASLPLKDASEMLQAGKENDLRWAVIKEAQPYQPDGILNAADTWDRYKNRKSVECHPYPEQFEELNKKTYGWRFGSIVTITSGSGMGKTQFVREVIYDILKNTEHKVAYISLEEDVGDTVEGLMALELNKRIHLPDVHVDEEEERKAFETLFSSRRLELHDHFGGLDDESLFSRIRYFNRYLGCRVFAIDHLSIIISETADEGDERRRIDKVMTKLASLAKSLDIVIFLIVHLKKAPQGKSFEEGFVPSSDDLRGSAGIKQLSWDIIAIARNQKAASAVDRNTSSLHVLKCRFSGRTGPAGYVLFDENTGRLIKTSGPTEFDDEGEDDGTF